MSEWQKLKINNKRVMDFATVSEYERGRLSIIVPVYNTAAFLPRCLESLIGQTYRNLEIICVDDGSTDGSAAILDEYAAKDVRIKVIHQENAGVSAARNRGLDAATGELVAFVDADDWLEANTYETAVQAFCAGVDMVCFGCMVDGVSDATLEEYCNRIPSGQVQVTPRLVSRMNASVWNKVYRRKLLEDYDIRFPEGVAYGEDSAFFYCVAGVGTWIIGLPQRFYHYEQTPGSAMSRPDFNQRRVSALLVALQYVYRFYARVGVAKRFVPVLENIFGAFFLSARESGQIQSFSEDAWETAAQCGLLKWGHSNAVMELKNMKQPAWKKIFHWYTQNRECFGIGGSALVSVTYEEDARIYRVLGRRIAAVKEKE